MKKMYRTLILYFTSFLLFLSIVACDSRRTFFNENKILINSAFDFFFEGDTLIFINGEENNKMLFRINIFNTPPNASILLKVNFEGEGNLVLEEQGRVFPVNSFVEVNKNNLDFELSNDQPSEVFVTFTAKIEDVEKTFRKKFTFKRESNLISIDRSITIDIDSTKVGKEYAFKVKNNSSFSRKIKFFGLYNSKWDFFVKSTIVSENPIYLDTDDLILAANEERTFLAIAKNENLLNITEPYEHKSLRGGIRVSLINSNTNVIEDSREMSITIFDNLPPLKTSISVTKRFEIELIPLYQPYRYQFFIKVNGAVDGDEKWGGEIATSNAISFEGYKDVIYVDENLMDIFGYTSNYKFYYIEGLKHRIEFNDNVSWRLGYKADQVGKSFPINTEFDLYREIEQYATIPSPYDLRNMQSMYNPHILYRYNMYPDPNYTTNGKMTNMVLRLGVRDNEGKKTIIEVPVD